jgi:hypothetical protein
MHVLNAAYHSILRMNTFKTRVDSLVFQCELIVQLIRWWVKDLGVQSSSPVVCFLFFIGPTAREFASDHVRLRCQMMRTNLCTNSVRIYNIWRTPYRPTICMQFRTQLHTFFLAGYYNIVLLAKESTFRHFLNRCPCRFA